MAPCLSKFPSVCLEAIFKNVPLVDLFYSVGLVCTSWYKSRRTELMRRRRFRLIYSSSNEDLEYRRVHDNFYGTELIERVRRDDGSPWHTLETLEQFKFNWLPVPRDMKAIPFFSSLMNMSNITCVHLVVCTTTDLTLVIRLLDHLSEHLADLNLEIGFYLKRDIKMSISEDDDDDNDDDNNDEDDDDDVDAATREHALNVANVIDCLNRLQSLRHLNLDLSGLSSNPPLLSCISHLTTFAIRATCFDFVTSMNGWIYASIKQYAQNVTSIQMDNQVGIREMLQFDARLASKFTDLSVSYEDLNEDYEKDNIQVMSLFFARFSFLTKLYLNLSFSKLPMTKLARCLYSLTQLVYLDLEFSFIPPVEEVQPEEGEEEDQVDGHRQQAQQKITQVLSVRLLTLEFFTKSHHDTERLFVTEIFPSLQVLRLKHYFEKCSDCEISRIHYNVDELLEMDGFDQTRLEDIELARRVAECKRLTRQPFRRCANLHTIALANFDNEITLIINID